MARNEMLRDFLVNWAFTLLFLPLTLLLLVQNYGSEFVLESRYLGLILEFVFVGMIPLLIVLVRGERWEEYGFNLSDWRRSIAYALVFLLPFLAFRTYAYLNLNYVGWSWGLGFPIILGYIPIYGPLEVFFLVFSIYKLDRAFSSKRIFSMGVLLTAMLFGLMHVFNYLIHRDMSLILTGYLIGNIIPALLIGVIYRKTRSMIGPSIFWTVLNFL